MTGANIRRTHISALLLTAWVNLVSIPAAAQDSIPFIRPDAQLGSIDFRFESQQSFSTSDLGRVLGLKARGSLYGVRQLLGKLPFIGAPGSHRFDPIELQKDVVRLTRFYKRSGFITPEIDYGVKANPEGTLVDVTFLIHEGPSLTLREIKTALPPDVALPESLLSAWHALETDLAGGRGQRFGDAEAATAERRVMTWLQDHGYPRAATEAEREIQPGNNQVDVTLRVSPGTRRRLGSVTVEGNESVSDDVVLRQVPFHTGDWYSAAALGEGRSRIQQVDLFPQVQVGVDSSSLGDSILPVRIVVQESRPRLALAEVGLHLRGGRRHRTGTMEPPQLYRRGPQPDRFIRGAERRRCDRNRGGAPASGLPQPDPALCLRAPVRSDRRPLCRVSG